MSEAVDQLRIRHCWEVLDQENKAIKEHRAKRKACRNKQGRDLLGQWTPHIMENGETMPQIMARSRHIILKHKPKWNEQQSIRVKIIFEKQGWLPTTYDGSQEFTLASNSSGILEIHFAGKGSAVITVTLNNCKSHYIQKDIIGFNLMFLK